MDSCVRNVRLLFASCLMCAHTCRCCHTTAPSLHRAMAHHNSINPPTKSRTSCLHHLTLELQQSEAIKSGAQCTSSQQPVSYSRPSSLYPLQAQHHSSKPSRSANNLNAPGTSPISRTYLPPLKAQLSTSSSTDRMIRIRTLSAPVSGTPALRHRHGNSARTTNTQTAAGAAPWTRQIPPICAGEFRALERAMLMSRSRMARESKCFMFAHQCREQVCADGLTAKSSSSIRRIWFALLVAEAREPSVGCKARAED
jgi:hypothetical protein